jgi:hypothetical protein
MSMYGGEADELLAKAERNFAKAAAQAEVATAEAKRKEEKMKMCKYSPDLSMECVCFPCMLNNSIRPFSQCKHKERWQPWQHGGRRMRATHNLTNDIQYIDSIILLWCTCGLNFGLSFFHTFLVMADVASVALMLNMPVTRKRRGRHAAHQPRL